MSVVCTERVFWNGEYFRKVFRINKDGQFRCTLPDNVQKVVGHKDVSGETLSGCKQAFDDALAQTKAAKTTEEKIIRYRFLANLQTIRRGLVDVSLHQLTMCDGTAISLEFGAFIKRTTKLAGKSGMRSRVVYEAVEISPDLPDSAGTLYCEYGSRQADVVELPWTAEREAFFVQLYLALESVILKLLELRDDKHLLQMIANGTPLLAAPAAESMIVKPKRRKR